MIRKLQKKFILIAAGALFTMILLVMAAVNCAFYFQTRKQLDSRLDLIMNGSLQAPGASGDPAWESAPRLPGRMQPPDGSQPSGESPVPGQEPPADTGKSFGFLPRLEDFLRIHPDGCLIRLDSQGSVIEILQDGAENYSETELASIAAALLQRGKSQGWYQYFRFRMAAGTGSGGAETLIGLVNASSGLYSVSAMLLISSVIGALSFLLVLMIILLASRHAVKPISESYAKQKQFVTDAGHELKTPLTVISADNELARMLYGDSEWFDSIDRQVARMNRLVQDLITLAKMDEEQKPVFSAFDLSEAVFDTAKSFDGLIRSRGKQLTLDIAPGIVCTGDESGLRRIVSILMDNAAKYCAAGGTVSVRLTAHRQIRLQVVNDLDANDTCDPDKMFERFYRADRARTSDGSYGLGLSIARSIAELHRASLRARLLDNRQILLEMRLPASPASRHDFFSSRKSTLQ